MKITTQKLGRAFWAATTAAGFFAMAAPAMAATETVDALIVTGTLFEDQQAGTVSVDYWQFDVSTAGTVTIDVLSRSVLGGDGAGGGVLSDLDSQIRLFEFDSGGDQGLLGSFISGNDDFFFSSGAGDADGSVSFFDSYMSVALGVGSYVLSLSDWPFDEAEARSGVNFGTISGTYADYQITFSGIDVAPVPLPAALPLLLGGVGMLGFVGRRRSRAKTSA